MVYFIENFRNNLNFFLRNLLNFSRKNYKENPERPDKQSLSENQTELISSLEQRYGSLSGNYSNRIFLENIYFLNVFDKYFSKNKAEKISVLDIGSKNWSYAESEYLYFGSFTNNLTLKGIELDAYRLSVNLYSRYEIAKFYTEGMKNTSYIPGDFMKHEDKYDYMVWILPFITEYPLLRWGLPLKYFMPEKMLMHAYNHLNPGGELLIINQGENEFLIQKELYRKLNIQNVCDFGEIEDSFGLFRNKRYCSKIVKQ